MRIIKAATTQGVIEIDIDSDTDLQAAGLTREQAEKLFEPSITDRLEAIEARLDVLEKNDAL